MVSCKEKNRELKMIRGKQIEISKETASDSDFIKTIQPYKDSLFNQINEVLCYNPKTLSRTESPLESSLGNFYADACLKSADSIFLNSEGKHIDFALFNYGGIRTSIPKGNVTVESIFNLMPFENKLVVVQLNGADIEKLLNYLAVRKEAHPIAGIELVLNKDQFAKVFIRGNKFDAAKTYWVLTHDYLQHGGDNMSFFKEPIELISTNYKVRDALIDNLRKIDTLYAALDDRFIKSN